MAGSTFPKFGELPTEIRIIIWIEAALEPRIIEFADRYHGERFQSHINLLLACKESAEIASPICKDSPITGHLTGRTIYFNYDRDIMYITGIYQYQDYLDISPSDRFQDMKLCLKHCHSIDPDKVQYLAFGMDLGVCPNVWRCKREDHDEITAKLLANWLTDAHDHIYGECEAGGLQTMILVFDPMKQRERRPHHGDYAVAKDLSIIDPSKSETLRFVWDKMEAKCQDDWAVQRSAHGPFWEQLLEFPPRNRYCSRGCPRKNAGIKIRFGTIQRERIGITHETKLSRSWRKTVPYTCDFCSGASAKNTGLWSNLIRLCKPASWKKSEAVTSSTKSRGFLFRHFPKISQLCRETLKRLKSTTNN